MDNEQEQQQIKWGEARSQMRITLEIFFVDNGALINVKSNMDDILPKDNGALLLARSVICEKNGGIACEIAKSTHVGALNVANRIRSVEGDESLKAKLDEIEAAFGTLKEDDEQDENED